MLDLTADQLAALRSASDEELRAFGRNVLDVRSAAINITRQCNRLLGLSPRDERDIAVPASLHSLPASLPGDPPKA